jgi:hypothetical protein
MIDSTDGSHVLYDKLRILKQTGPAGSDGLRLNIVQGGSEATTPRL